MGNTPKCKNAFLFRGKFSTPYFLIVLSMGRKIKLKGTEMRSNIRNSGFLMEFLIAG
jgi:hypothetical protein